MEFSSIDSELLESLDYLRPSVKRVFRNTKGNTNTHLDSRVNTIKVLKDFRKHISKECQSKIRTVESSTSLILKKTTDREIRQEYSVLSYTNLSGPRLQNTEILPNHSVSKEKPLIKVTVFPKSVQTQPPNVLKKRKNIPKKIHATVSNQENSIQTKNVYLVVQGRKREKVYEIKTTGSAKITSSNSKNEFKDEGIPLEQLSSLKLVLDSLNMDRDREKKSRRRKKPDVDNFVEYSRMVRGNEKCHECSCWNEDRGKEKLCGCCTCLDDVRGEVAPDPNDCMSRVRITGRLGLTEDDRYVLRCAATVNDKPIATKCTAVDSTAPYTYREERRFNNACERDCCLTRCYNAATYSASKQKRDFNIQADLQSEKKSVIAPTPRVMLNKESQATQVNFNTPILDAPKCKNQFLIKDEIIQCCRTKVDTHAGATDSDSDSNSLKDCQSPLVIISVYPAQDCCENVKVVKNLQDNIRCSSPRKPNAHNPQRPNSGTKLNNDKKTDNKKSRPRSRSPSPQNRNVGKHHVAETRIVRTSTKKVSPGSEVTPSANRQNKSNLNKAFNKPNSTKYSQRYDSAHIKETKGINTEPNLTKKILVDTYTKKLTDYLNSGNDETMFQFPQSDPSKVTVNIDGDNEYYDVLFEKADNTTDLKVRKTVKGNSNKKHTENLRGTSPNMNNLLLNEEPKRRSSPIHNNNQQKNDEKVKKTFSRLQVRDSIEIISHRRECKPTVDCTAKCDENSKFDYDCGQFSAPIKHYRGDSCSIADPIKRDKEIRALLGVDKCVHASVGIRTQEKNIAVPVHYLHENTGQKKIVTGINIMEISEPPCVCCDISKSFGQCNQLHLQPPRQMHHPHTQPQMYRPQLPMYRPPHQMYQQPPLRAPSKHNKKNMVIPSQIDKEIAQYDPAVSGSESPQENLIIESPSPAEESPSPAEDSPSPLEETRSPVLKKMPSVRHESKTAKKSSNNAVGTHASTQDETELQRTSLYQQLILNRNIQVFLQVEQFSKQKPIILSRKQYDKVKRTIESTIASKTGRENKRNKCICKSSLVSVGEVRRKPLPDQTTNNNERKSQIQGAKKTSILSKKSKGGRSVKEPTVLFTTALNSNNEEKATVISRQAPVTPRKATVIPRQVMSSIEIQYASMSFMKRVTSSSTNVEAGSTCHPPLEKKESHSILTIFKGPRKSFTPNLGTSIYSLYSEDNNALVSPKPVTVTQESKQKKPFLRRLMSCLVMRSTRVSELKVVPAAAEVPSLDSSIDSYHISTSLGAIEVSSSLYDTSASFYSNHSVYPVCSKTKRGFFTSVREFLTIGKG